MFLYRLRIQKLNKCTCNVFCSGVGKNREQKEILRKWHNWWRCRWIPNYQGWTFIFFCIFKIFCFFCSMKGLGCLNKRRCGRRLNYWGWTCSFFNFRFSILYIFGLLSRTRGGAVWVETELPRLNMQCWCRDQTTSIPKLTPATGFDPDPATGCFSEQLAGSRSRIRATEFKHVNISS